MMHSFGVFGPEATVEMTAALDAALKNFRTPASISKAPTRGHGGCGRPRAASPHSRNRAQLRSGTAFCPGGHCRAEGRPTLGHWG
jgi:hypothetical protein